MAANDTLGLNQVFQIYHEDGSVYEGLVMHRSATDSVVMSLGDSISGDVYWRDNELALTMKEYITYNGVNYVLVNPPTIVREGMVADNSELNGMTKYSFKFYHPMYQLGNFPFTDVAVTNDQKKYLSENKTFSWIGTANDFLAKLNKNLDGTVWIVEMSSRFPSAKRTEMSDVIAFDKNTVADAMKTAYDTWGVPYVIDVVSSSEASYASGKRFKVVWGLPSNEIYESAEKKQLGIPYVFKMGKGVGLKNNSRTPRNNKIITRIAGYGSENNIPYGYPQIVWTGNQSWDYTINNSSSASNSYPIYDGIVGGQKVRLIKHPFTRTHLMPNVYVNAVNKKVNPNATGYDPDIELKDYYDAVAGGDYPNPINLQAPSYDIHEFEDIKPELGSESIVSVTPLNPDLTPASSWDDTMDDDGNYIQSYFQITLPTLSFDIYACAAITEAMQINMRSGACLGCTFPVEIDWEDYKANFYNENGEFDPVIHTSEGDGHVRNGKKYPDSSNSSTPVTLILKKEIETFGTLMPNIYQHPVSGDQFVVLGISLPTSYITNAQTRLDNAMKSYMLENNVYYYDYPLKFDEAFLRKNTYVLEQIKPNSIIRFEFAGETLQLFVKQMNVKFGEGVLPKYDITLTDNVDVVLNQIGKVSDNVEKLATLISLLRQSYGNNVLVELAKKLSKVDDDTAQGYIRFIKGLQVGERFVTGLLGEGGVFNKDADGKTYIEADKLYIRMKAYFDTVEIRKYMHSGGNRIASPAGAKCVRVENMAWYAAENKYVPVDDYGTYWKKDINGDEYEVATGLSIVRYRCYFRGEDNDGDKVTNDFVVGDQAYCHITNGATYSLQMHHYWRLVVDRNTEGSLTDDGEFWIDLAATLSCTIGGVTYAGYQSGSDIPKAQDDIVQLGNVNDSTRRGAIIEFVSGNDAPSYQIFQDIGTPEGSTISEKQASQYSLEDKNYIGIGYKSSTGRAYMNVYGDAYIGDPEGSTFIKYEQEDSETGLPKMTIKAVVEFQSPDDPTQTTTLDDFAQAVLDGLENIQSQIDGTIDTWFYDYMPVDLEAQDPTEPLLWVDANHTIPCLPYKDWYDADTAAGNNNERIKHLGDIFYDNKTGYAFRFSNTGTEANPNFAWVEITDSAVIKALEDAAKAQDTADHKRRVFTAQPYPPYDVGDLWSNAIYPANNTEKDASTNKYYKDLLTCKTAKTEGQQFSIVDWGLSTNYTDDTGLNNFVNNTYAPFVTNIQGQVDKKAETWYQDTDPSVAWTTADLKANHVGDIWCDTSQNGGKKTYIWKDFGTSANPRYAWAEQAVPDAVFDKIDGKADIFVSKPTTYNTNDMWIIESGLSSTDMPTGCQSGDIVISNASRVNNYQKTDWSKKDRYTDDTKYNNFISALLNGMPAGSGEAAVEAALNAIKAALNQGTTVSGGLVLSTLIGLRDSNNVLWSGINGQYDANALGGGVAAWYGGGMVDHEVSPSALGYAKSLFRFDGSGYLAGGNIIWNANGAVTIKNITTLSDSQNTNLLNELATFNSAFSFATSGSGSTTVLSITPNVPFTSLSILDTSVSPNVARPVATQKWVGDNYVSIAFFNALFTAYSDANRTTAINPATWTAQTAINNLKILVGTWTEQYMSALGYNPTQGGGGSTTLAGLTDVTITNPVAGQALVYRNNHWVNESIGSGSVNAVVVGTTQYSPIGGIVSLPAYPTTLPVVTDFNFNVNRLQYLQISDSQGASVEVNDAPSSSWWHIIRTVRRDADKFYTDIAIPFTDYTMGIHYKVINKGTLVNNGWVRLIDTINYTEYTVTKTGQGASGTWDITASTASKLNTGNNIFTAWGRPYWSSGVPSSISGDMSSVGDIAFSASGKNISGMLYFNTTESSSGAGDTQLIVGTSATKTTYSHGQYTITPKLHVDGLLSATSFISTNIELFYTTPYIDFHYQRSSSDYTSRIIEEESGKLAINQALFVKGWGNVSIGSSTISDTYKLLVNGYTKTTRLYLSDSIYLEVANNAVHVVGGGLYADTYVSALGSNSQQSGGGGVGDVTWDLLASSSDTHQIAASHLNVLNGYAQQSWVTSQGYLNQTAADNRYLKLTGGVMSNTNVVTNLNADMLDGMHGNKYVGAYDRIQMGDSPNFDDPSIMNGFFELRNIAETPNATGTRPFDGYSGFLTLKSVNVMMQLAGSNYYGWFIRGAKGANITLSGFPWQQLARTTDNVASATKLETARTLWGQSFDGTANVSGDMSSVGDIAFSASGKNIGGMLYFNTTESSSGAGDIQLKVSDNATKKTYLHQNIYLITPKLHVDGNISAESFFGKSAELYFSTPYIDFHYNYSVSDYTSRIIEYEENRLSINDSIFAELHGNASIGSSTISDTYKLLVNGYTKTTRLYLSDSIYLEVSNNAVHIVGGGLYADTYVSALGSNSQQSGGGGVGDVTWDLLASSSDTHQIAASHLNVLNSYAQQSWVTSQGYLNQTAADNRYLKLTGGVMSNTNVVTNMNADLLDGLHSSSMVLDAGGGITGKIYDVASKRVFSGQNVPDAPTTGWVSGLVLGSNWNNNHYQHYLVESQDGRWYTTKHYTNGSMDEWNTFAYLTDNVASATKLQNARNINGTSFDGTTDITTTKWGESRNITIKDADSTNAGSSVSVNGSAAVNLLLPSTIKATLTGNASTATKLAASVTLWGQSFDGSANVSGNLSSVTGITGTGAINGFHAIELNMDGNLANYGGFIDFHFNKNNADYTSRLIEDASGRLNINNAIYAHLNGNVGIGTASPAQKLDVDGNIKVGSIYASGNYSSYAAVNTDISVSVRNNNGTIALLTSSNRGLYENSANNWLIATNGTNSWLAIGNVGIGTNSPSKKLEVAGYTKTSRLYLSDDIYLVVQNNAVHVVGGGLYADTYVSALGANSSSSGGGFDTTAMWNALSAANPTTAKINNSHINLNHLTIYARDTVSVSYDGQTTESIRLQNYFVTNNTSQEVSGVKTFMDNFFTGSDVDFMDSGSNTFTSWIPATFKKSVGIGGYNSSYKLYVSGDAYTTKLWIGSNVYLYPTNVTSGGDVLDISAAGLRLNGTNITSDIRRKDIVSYVNDLSVEKISLAPIFNFKWKQWPNGLTYVGTSAQYWNNVLPNAVMFLDDIYSLDYGATALASAVMIARKVLDHDGRIRLLEIENQALRKEIEQLKANLKEAA